MVLPLEWMMHADIYILDELMKTNRIYSVKDMAVATDYQRSYMSRRYGALREAGLIEQPEDEEVPADVNPIGMARITDKGERYMNEELSDEELEELENVGKSS